MKRLSLKFFLKRWRRPSFVDAVQNWTGGDDALLVAVVEGLSDEVVEKLARRAMTHAGAARAYAAALQKLGREPEAQRFLDQAQVDFPDDEGLRFQRDALARHRYLPLSRAYALLSLRDFDGARAAFASALSQVGRRVPAEALTSVLCGAGWVEFHAGAAKLALEFFDRAARVDPHFMDAHHGAGSALRALGEGRAARCRFGRAARLNPSAPAPLACIGWVHYEAACFAAARRAFHAARRRNSLDLESAWGWAWSLWRCRDDGYPQAFAAALQVGWHGSGSDLLMLARQEEHLHFLLPLIIKSSSSVSIHIAEEAAGRWLKLPLDNRLEAAVLLRHAGLHRLLVRWIMELEDAEDLLDEGIQAAIFLEDKETVATFLEMSQGKGDALVRGKACEYLGNLEKARRCFMQALEDGELAAPAHLEDVERRLRFGSLNSLETEILDASGDDPAYPVRELLLARRQLDQGDRAGAVARLRKVRNERASQVLESLEPVESPRTDPGILAAVLAGRTPSPSGRKNSLWCQAARILEKGRRRGFLRRRQVKRVLRCLEHDPEDQLLARAARAALELMGNVPGG